MSAATASALRDLRELLDLRFPDAMPVPRRQGEIVATGVEELDALLPNGGFPRGRLSVWAPRGGATAVLRASCRAAVGGGERAVWVDGDGTVAGAFWEEGTILIRPRSRIHALRAAETLLRSGGFALVVLAGADPEGTENVRLSRAAHEGGGACVALTNGATTSALKASSTIRPSGYRWQRDPRGDLATVDAATLDVRVTALGWHRRGRITLPIVRHELRLALDPSLPDRRGGNRASARRR